MTYAVLKHKAGRSAYEDHVLSKPVTTVGRSNSADVVINDTSISRIHFRLENRNNRYFLVDNNSSNGSFVNRRKITEAPLKHGDEIIAGRIHFVFSQEESGAEDGGKTQPLSLLSQERHPMEPPPTISVSRTAKNPADPQTPPPIPPPMAASSDEDDTLGDATRPQVDLDDPLSRPLEVTPKPRPGAETLRTDEEWERATPVSRLLAFLVDWALALALMIPGILFGLLQWGGLSLLFTFLGSLAILAHPIIGWLKYGKTLGKHFLGIHIVETEDSSRIGLQGRTLILRILGYFLCALFMYLPFLWILFDEEGLGPHDKIAGTRVVKS